MEDAARKEEDTLKTFDVDEKESEFPENNKKNKENKGNNAENNNTKSKKSASKSVQKSSAKKPHSTKKTASKKNNNKNHEITAEIVSIAVAGLSILTIIGVYFGGGGIIGQGIGNALKGFFGFGAYILPLMLIGFCIYMFFTEKKVINAHKTIMIFSMFFLLISFLHITHIDSKNIVKYENFGVFSKTMYKNGGYFNGGLFGAYLGSILYKAVGKAASIILIILAFICSGIFVTGKSFFEAVKNLWKRISSYFVFDEDVDEDIDEEYFYEDENYSNKKGNIISFFKKKFNEYNDRKSNYENDDFSDDIRQKVKNQRIIENKKNEEETKRKAKNYKDAPKPTVIKIKPKAKRKGRPIKLAYDTVMAAKGNMEPAKSKKIETDLPSFIKNRELFEYEKFLEKGQRPSENNLNNENLQDKNDFDNAEYNNPQYYADDNEQNDYSEYYTDGDEQNNYSGYYEDDSNQNNDLQYYNDNSEAENYRDYSSDLEQNDFLNDFSFENQIGSENYSQSYNPEEEIILDVSSISNNLDSNLNSIISESNDDGIVLDVSSINSDIDNSEQYDDTFSSSNIQEDDFDNYLNDFSDSDSLNDENNDYAYTEDYTNNEPIVYEKSTDENTKFEFDENDNFNSNGQDIPPWEEPSLPYYEQNDRQTENYSDSEKLNSQEPVIIKAEKSKIVDRLDIDKEAKKTEYVFPKLEFLNKNPMLTNSLSSEIELLENSKILVRTLASFNVDATVIEISKGPAVTRYELSIVDGIKVSKILGLADNLALSLAATSIRIEAPIPGKSAVGIEIPNKEVTGVYLSEVLCDEKFQKFPSKLSFGLGKDIAGNVVVTDIAKMPHMLIAGATGSGKSVCINTLITSLLYKSTPDEVRLIMIDPKVVELSIYNGIPHLLVPVVTEPSEASGALNWAVREMMERYNRFAQTSTRNLEGYNNILAENGEEKLPQIVIIIDELADLMMVAAKEVEAAICRLAQLARAAGIHLIIATQRPSVDVITGLIKANIPSRIAFAVSSGTDSRTIIDTVGAEKLLGKGDMLFKAVDMNKALRVQGAFVSDKEVEKIVEFLKENNSALYDEKVINEISNMRGSENGGNGGNDYGTDELTNEVISFIVKNKKCSTSLIQRKFRLGYNRAARIVEELEDRGIIGPENGSKPREVLMDKYQMEEYFTRNSGY